MVHHRHLFMSALVGALVACSDSSSVMGPGSMPGRPTVSDAEILVGGQSIRGVVSVVSGEPTLFSVRVHAPGGLSTVRRVVLQYAQPGPNRRGGPMMGGFRGTVLCYDDGTHGDDVAGDGIYHFMDPDDAIGCHGINAPTGEYRYELWCEDVFDQQSNVLSMTVVRE